MKLKTVILALVLLGIFTINVKAEKLPGVKEISEKIKNAADPKGVFQNCSSYIIRQKIIVCGGKEGEFRAETKFKSPDMLSSSYYFGDKLLSKVIIKGDKAWRISGADGSTSEITGNELVRLLLFNRISSPKAMLSDIFEDIKIDLEEINGEKFYRLECITKSDELTDIVFFVDAETFLQRKMFTINDMGEHYSAETVNYKVINNVFLPCETIVFTGGIKQRITIEEFLLNQEISDAEFAIPVSINKK